jgi:cytidylate kinase
MEERFQGKEAPLPESGKPGPVVTISREAGCSGNDIAQGLLKRLEEILRDRNKKSRWKVINKEIISEAARELETHPSKIEHIFKGKEGDLLEDMILSMSTKYHKSDWRIRKSIREVIRFQAAQGHVIIVGRAGVVITQEHPQALHIKLQAPLEWRTKMISNKHGIPVEKAREYVEEVDRSRQKLLQDFRCKPSECEFFDVILNCKTFSQEEIVKIIIGMMVGKGMV